MPEQPNGLGETFRNATQADPFSLESQLLGLQSANGLPAQFEDNDANGGNLDAMDPSRRTLAFELASVEPTAHNSDLLAELGIEDAPGQGNRDASLPADDDDGPGDRSHIEDESLLSHESENPARTPLRKAKSRASYASLRQSPDTRTGVAHKPSLSFSNGYTLHEEAEEDVEHALSRSQAEGQAKLSETMLGVQEFIVKLQDSNDPAVADQQNLIERLATSYIKDMYKSAKAREDSLRELREVQRAWENPDPAWQTILADLEPILPHEYGLPSESLLPIRKTRLATLVEEESGPAHASANGSSPLLQDTKVLAQLVHMRSLTDSLIASLYTVSEQTQIAKAANHDISRRLKSLDSGVVKIRGEAESLERSLKHIAAFEAEEQKDTLGSRLKQTALPGLAEPRRRKTSSNSTRSISSNGSLGASGRYSQQVKGELKSASRLLESAHERARLLLTSHA